MRFASTIILLSAFLLALNLTYSVPFHFTWDMDLTTVLDLFRLGSGKIPSHMAHPGLGFYWLLFWFQQGAVALHLITPSQFSNLATSLEPIVLIAEHTDFLRGANALICFSVPVAAHWSLIRRDDSRTLSVLSLLIFLTLPGIWRFDLIHIRTETVSLLFWVLTISFTIRAARSDQKQSFQRDASIAGFLAALSFFTKIQSLFLVAFIPVLFTMTLRLEKRELGPQFGRIRSWGLVLILIGFFVFVATGLNQPVPKFVEGFADGYNFNKFAMLFIGAIAFVFVPSGPIGGQRLGNLAWQPLRVFLGPFIIGASAVMIVPFLFGLDFQSSLQYAILTFKMIFLRSTVYGTLGHIPLIQNSIQIMFTHGTYLVLLFCCATCATFTLAKNKDRTPLVYGLVILLITVAHVFLATRADTQDAIWIELPILVLAVLLLRTVRRPAVHLLAGLIIIMINLNSIRTWRIPEKELGYYDSHVFYEEVYTFNDYWNISLPAYASKKQKDQAFQFALNWHRWENLVFANFPDSSLNPSDVSYSDKDSEPIISLRRFDVDQMTLRYRKDLMQFVLFKNGKEEVKSPNCKIGDFTQISWRGQNYTGYEITSGDSDLNKNLFCQLRSKNLKEAIILVRQIAVATWREPNLRERLDRN